MLFVAISWFVNLTKSRKYFYREFGVGCTTRVLLRDKIIIFLLHIGVLL